MSPPTVTLRPADGDACPTADADPLDYVETLLARNDLPIGDVRSKSDCLCVAHDDGAVGVGGVEVHGTAGLLRSVVVEADARGEGYGAAICEALEREARAAGVETLHLLTTTAADFFATRGYEPVERSAAPERLQETAEFADLCPETATCMRKRF